MVTGFEPFDGHSINVSWEVAQALHGRLIASEPGAPAIPIRAAQISCRFAVCTTELIRLIDQYCPVLVLCLGQAEGRRDITVERVALNLRDARIPDNGGSAPVDEPIEPDGPYAYPAKLPTHNLVRQLLDRGHPVSISNSAGTFVCNDLFYGLMHKIHRADTAGGFIHLPILPEQRRGASERTASREDAPHGFDARTPAISLTVQVAAIEAAVSLVLHSLRAEHSHVR